jgi:hypothetical protein
MHWVNRPTTQGLSMFGRLGRHPASQTAPCAQRSTFAWVRARPRGRGLRFRIRPEGHGGVRITLLRVSAGRRVLAGLPVRRFGAHRSAFAWSGAGRGVPDGYYVLRFTGRGDDGRQTSRSIALRRIAGRFHMMRTFERRRTCGALASFSLGNSVFGGRSGRSLLVSFELAERARVAVEIRLGQRVVGRFRARTYMPGTHRLRFRARGVPPGGYDVRLRVGHGRWLKVRARAL